MVLFEGDRSLVQSTSNFKNFPEYMPDLNNLNLCSDVACLVFTSTFTEAHGLYSDQMFTNETVRLNSLVVFQSGPANDIDHEQQPTFLAY